MKWSSIFAILIVFCFGLAGCLTGSGKQVRFTCDRSTAPREFEKQITEIALSHQFVLAPPEKVGLRFYSQLKSEPTLFAVVSESPTQRIDLGISVLRGPGTEDKLPDEVLDAFDTVVLEFAKRFEKSCTLQH